jgi:hypothetical protein
MNNLLKKAQIIQFIIIISFIILSNLNNDEKILDKNTEYYDFLVNIVKYNKIIKEYLKDQNIPESLNIILDNNEYFYFFYNKNNVLTYFFKEKNSNEHSIYFCGIDNLNDIKTIVTILLNNYSFENIEKILHKDGTLYKIIDNKIEKVNENINNIYNIFDYFVDNFYNKEDNNEQINNECKQINKECELINEQINNECELINEQINKECELINEQINNESKLINNECELINEQINKECELNNKHINLKVNGYSLGGPFSQVFAYNIIQKYSDRLNITIFNIESWFGGNKELYDKLTENIEIFNTYNNKSILYFFNILFQKYFKSDYIIKNNVKNINEDNIDNYVCEKFPHGIVKYIKNNHLLSHIFKNDV